MKPASAGQSVSVVIPVINAEKYLPDLLKAIFSQKPTAPDEVILVDSMSTDRTRAIGCSLPNVRVIPIERFSHGGARNLGVREARGQIVVLMTQDALPRDASWLARLLEPFSDPDVAATYSRQEPQADANPMESYFLRTNFPPELAVRRAKTGGAPLNLRTSFFSNVSAALRRDLLLKFPFDETLIMSEDQQVSRDLIRAGYAVVYQPSSVVLHSHNYTLPIVFRRYFDSVYSLTKIFPKHDIGVSASMGMAYLWREFRYMVKHHPATLPYYFLYTAMKAAGTVAAHFADTLPRSVVRRLSLHRYHWQEDL